MVDEWIICKGLWIIRCYSKGIGRNKLKVSCW